MIPPDSLSDRLFDTLCSIPLIDPHTHIDPLSPHCETLADILTYHYYTELVHSAGMPREVIEHPDLSAKEKLSRLIDFLDRIDNTIQHEWIMEMCRVFFGFHEDALTPENWESVYDSSEKKMASDSWETSVLETSGIEKVFLTNDFDDPLEGWDTQRYVPCLRCDDLVFHLSRPQVQGRLEHVTNISVKDVRTFSMAIASLFEHFTSHGAKACAISLPPDFLPVSRIPADIDPLLQQLFLGKNLSESEHRAVQQYVFWQLAQCCQEYNLPFQLMIGVHRQVYRRGVYQGQDLFDQQTSLFQFRELFNAFPNVKFPISVLTSSQNQELVAYSWIFPNVYCFGHWWYSNVPTFIDRDERARIQAVPKTKQMGWYSDVYKLEFALPKCHMYRRVLANILAEDFVLARNWSEDRAIDLGKQILRTNVETVFDIR